MGVPRKDIKKLKLEYKKNIFYGRSFSHKTIVKTVSMDVHGKNMRK